MRTGRTVLAYGVGALLLGALPFVTAHGHEPVDMGMQMEAVNVTTEPEHIAPPSYFRHGHHAGWMSMHVALMLLAWIVVLPMSIMLSIARSPYNIPVQLLFHVANSAAVLGGFVYNHATLDLYENNSHHPIGWVLTAVIIVWTLMSLFVACAERKTQRRHNSHGRSLTSNTIAHYERLQGYHDPEQGRWLGDSGQGTERNSASLFGGSRQHSQDSVLQKPESGSLLPDDIDPAKSEEHEHFGDSRVDQFVSRNVRRCSSPRMVNIVRTTHAVVEKFLLLLGFLGITSGFIIYGGLFRNGEIFSGLAHFIKGGIFFWYGLLTLGRWLGSWRDLGWAWNLRPDYPVSRWKSRIPSAEFTESFVIWFYGASNVFLEHLNNWGGEWSPSDFEHVSITILFFGGGLLGMLIESRAIRHLINMPAAAQKQYQGEVTHVGPSADNSAEDFPIATQPPNNVSLNPIPALVILILGLMMSSHHQKSMVSTMMHAQWGTLFYAFALARVATCALLYLRPPTSAVPSRPPTELVAAFCLIAGGLLFMLSAHDVVWGIESNGLDAMTVFTVTVGLTGLIMAWQLCVFAVKGWAVWRECGGRA